MNTKSTPMCCVTIGYQALLMPAMKGMRLVELLQESVLCQEDYDHDAKGRHRDIYCVNDPPRVEYRAVRSDQIVFPPDAPQPETSQRTALPRAQLENACKRTAK